MTYHQWHQYCSKPCPKFPGVDIMSAWMLWSRLLTGPCRIINVYCPPAVGTVTNKMKVTDIKIYMRT